MIALRAGIALGTHQWHVVVIGNNRQREIAIEDRKSFPSRQALRSALRRRHMVLLHDNRIVSADTTSRG